MPKRSNLPTRSVVDGDRPPLGATRRQRREWIADALRRRKLVTANVAAHALAAAVVAGDGSDGQAVTEKPGIGARMWAARPLFAALALITGLLYVIIPTQIGYYRGIGGLDPMIAGVSLHTYLTVPVVTEALSAYMGLLAGYTIHVNSGRYRRYLKTMWLFAAVAAVVNVKSGWNVGDSTHITAFLLGGLSLCVPLVWHFYAGITLQVKHNPGMTIADLAAISQAWFRHPLFSLRTARAVDLFPDMNRRDVWSMIVEKHKEKLVQKWSTTPAERRELKRAARIEAAGRERARLDLAGVRHVGDVIYRFGWLTTLARREPKMNHRPEDEPTVTSTVNVLERPGAPAETAAETTGELRARQFIIHEWHEQCGAHLPDSVRLDKPKWGTGKRVADEQKVSTSYVSKIFGQCAAGMYDNPCTKSAPSNVDKVGE